MRRATSQDLDIFLHLQHIVHPPLLWEDPHVFAHLLVYECSFVDDVGYILCHPWCSLELPPPLNQVLPSNLPSPTIFVIHDVVVHPDHRTQGIGSQLVQEAIAYARAHGYMHVVLIALSPALGFWKKLGFQRLPWQNVDPAYGSDAVYMGKCLHATSP